MPYNIINPKRSAAARKHNAGRPDEIAELAAENAPKFKAATEAADIRGRIYEETHPKPHFPPAFTEPTESGITCRCGADRSRFRSRKEFNDHKTQCTIEPS